MMQVFNLKKTSWNRWNRVLFTKQSDNILLGKAISNEFMSKQSSELPSSNPYKSLRIGLHDYIFLNLTHRCFH